jgi:uncharacterized membrane protein YfcA
MLSMDIVIASWPVVLACTAAFVAGGVVKGVISIGLPMVGLPLLTLVVDVPTAVGLLLVPIFLSNLVQAIEGDGTLALLRRFAVLIACMVAGTFIGTALLARLDQKILLLVVGLFAVLASINALLNPRIAVTPAAERWLVAPVGLASGVIGGMSTLFGPILAIYVISLKLPRDVFVKCISVLYTVAAACLLVAGVTQKVAGVHELFLSSLAMIPVFAGMRIGRRIREKTDPELFRKLVLGVVLVTGANMVRQGLGW